jgi:uncharacterized 2Fe-2S/4Fe-4S cluster protein (DUF4445 family)
MTSHAITFQPANVICHAPTGALLTDALRLAGLDIAQPCGGQGRCGRCVVQVESGRVRRRSSLRLSAADLEAGYALACQSVIEGEATIFVPAQEAVERCLTTERVAQSIHAPESYDPTREQTVRVIGLSLDPPTLNDAVDDYARLQRGFSAHGLANVELPLSVLQTLGPRLREAEWQVAAIVETDTWRRPDGPPRLIKLLPSPRERGAGGEGPPLYGLAIDIGTTTVTACLVNLLTGQVLDSAAEYNGQIARGEDVISRIIYAGRNGGLGELRSLIQRTLNQLIQRLTQRNHLEPQQIYKATVAGNATMIHLFLELPPASIRLTPYIPTINHPLPILASEAGLDIHPLATVDCLPGVAAYVGADIAAGVLAAGLHEADALTLFIDVGTNGEIVLGNREWLLACACSAGPAFEGAGVVCGMRATLGAIEEVWINSVTLEPTWRVIGDVKPKGLCGSGLISLLAELFLTGVLDRGGHFRLAAGMPQVRADTPRVRIGEHGPEYVVAWADETATAGDITLTQVDVDNLMRAKAAIYAGFNVLAQSVGVELKDVERLVIGGAFGKYLNVEKAVQIGLLPDLPWERFQFLGNTAVLGAYRALLSRTARAQIKAIAEKMTYLELSADNTFYEAFTHALFLPHTELSRFPSVARLWENNRSEHAAPLALS